MIFTNSDGDLVVAQNLSSRAGNETGTKEESLAAVCVSMPL